MDKHTPGELTAKNSSFNRPFRRFINAGEDGLTLVAECYGDTVEEAEANRDRIVKAIKKLDELREFCEQQIASYKSHKMYPAYCMNATVDAYSEILNVLRQ